MTNMKVLSIFGTRPEAIKMAPVVQALKADKNIESLVCVTAQHRQMLDSVLSLFDIVPDFDLDIMQPGQDLFDITSRCLLGLREVLGRVKPDLVVVHGDTTTCFAATLAAFYQQIPVAHVEAGLRTHNLKSPFPEEANRALVGRLAKDHFAPTPTAKGNLIQERIHPGTITVTGNTVIDALLSVSNFLDAEGDERWAAYWGEKVYKRICSNERKMVLVTGHRRENFGHGFIDLCTAVRSLAEHYVDWDFVYPVHLNPNVRKPVFNLLGGYDNILLIDPQEYESFVWLMKKADVVLTDSGGVQEEAPSLGKPVLVMRNTTERPEAVEAGTVKLVGTTPARIYEEVERLLTDADHYNAMANAVNPYGDGMAASRIVSKIRGNQFAEFSL